MLSFWEESFENIRYALKQILVARPSFTTGKKEGRRFKTIPTLFRTSDCHLIVLEVPL